MVYRVRSTFWILVLVGVRGKRLCTGTRRARAKLIICSSISSLAFHISLRSLARQHVIAVCKNTLHIIVSAYSKSGPGGPGVPDFLPQDHRLGAYVARLCSESRYRAISRSPPAIFTARLRAIMVFIQAWCDREVRQGSPLPWGRNGTK